MRDDRQPHEQERFQLGALIASEQRPGATPEALAPHRLARLERALGAGPGRGVRVFAVLALVGTAAAAAVLVPRLRPASHEQPLYRASPELAIETAAGVPTFAAPGREGALQFQDGSEVRLAIGARVRLVAREPARAQVTVLQGQARFRVRHQDRTDWRVEAGPFRVLVTGTAFAVDWAADAARFQVAVTEGSVRVEGGGTGMGLPLLAGQSLTADATTGDMRVWRGGGASGGVQTSPSAQSAAAPLPPPTTPSAPAGHPPPTVPDRSFRWAALVDAGEYQRIVAEAQAMGIDRCLRSCSDEAKMALADAARYQGNRALALRVLATLTEGSPLGKEVARAHYLRGQIAEREGDRAAAALAYERCEHLDARGGYAALALGRLMAIRAASGDDQGARQVAERYLARHPDGPHADEARTLVSGGR
jgi:hypothetical protein